MLKLLKSCVLGLMAACFLTLSHGVLAAEPNYPLQPQGYINDDANLLNASDEEEVNWLLEELEQKTTAQVAVVTVATTEPETIEGYAVKLFEKWGIGKKGKDNGVLFLIASQDRRLRIETGYGLEGALPDVLCHQIIENLVVPAFKAGEYSKGITAGVQAIVGRIAKEYQVQITGQEEQNFSSKGKEEIPWIFILPIFLFLFYGVFIFPLIAYRRPGGYWYSGGGYSGGGGFGGGFGGFGGGFSGGGGASGRW